MNQQKHSKTESLECSSCSKTLVGLWVVLEMDESKKSKLKQTRIRCSCPYCGDKSFVKEVSGDFYMYPQEGLIVVESETLDDETVFIKLEKE